MSQTTNDGTGPRCIRCCFEADLSAPRAKRSANIPIDRIPLAVLGADGRRDWCADHAPTPTLAVLR